MEPAGPGKEPDKGRRAPHHKEPGEALLSCALIAMPLSVASTALMSMMTAVAALPVTRPNGTAATATMGSTVGGGDRPYWWNYGLGMCAGRAPEGMPRHTAKHLIVDGTYHSDFDCADVCLKSDVVHFFVYGGTDETFCKFFCQFVYAQKRLESHFFTVKPRDRTPNSRPSSSSWAHGFRQIWPAGSPDKGGHILLRMDTQVLMLPMLLTSPVPFHCNEWRRRTCRHAGQQLHLVDHAVA